ncbi:MAG: virulence-associated protein E [Clostridia bacterium]|nr:virulence-associated protein E [Clostridia bacterium]
MNYDRQIGISVGNSRKSLNWQNTQVSISEFYEKLKTPVRGTETFEEYMKMKKAQQDELKDCAGGFVGGTLNGVRRKANNITGRDIITLDFDNVPGWQTDTVLQKVEELNCNYCVYSTRKHTPSAPRLRIIIPLDRTVAPDEYEPCARRIAAQIGINMADPTTFELARLFYYPTCSADSEYVYKVKDAPLISADFLLSTYANWRDYASWPQVPNAVSYQKLAMKQGDPLEKTGIVGAFCRTYDVISAMEAFLPNIYEPVDSSEDRYTYLGGSTTGGAIIYDDAKFLYSHHATDPCGGRLVNAFDLVRLHRFGDKDESADPKTPAAKLPSYKAMCELAMQDKAVCTTLNREQHEQAMKDFEGVTAGDTPKDEPLDWAEKLQRNSQGLVAKTSANFAVILSEDPLLKGRIKYDTFSHRLLGVPPLPWGQREKATANFTWVDEDDSGLRMYIEKVYGIRAENMMSDAFNDCVARNSFNPVQDFLNGLTWDGIPRLDTLFVDYLGAENTDYNKAVTRKAFVAAVSRAMIPGCKYDNMLILSGPQGIGKSTLLDKMSYGWFNDSIRTFEGKEASELLRGVWIAEIAELDAFRRSDVARIKQFLSIREDRYREAYGHHVKTFPRSCVLFGTTNTTDFLQDATGNRRFWPIDVGEHKPTKNVFTELDNEKEQIWAEAKARWQTGEAMYLADAMAEEAIKQQEEHMSINPWEGLIREFLEKQIPADWSKWKLDRRLDYWAGATHGVNEIRLVNRERVCIPEIWCEAMKRRLGDISDNPKNNKEIGAILRRLGWVQKSNQRFGEYGLQRCFVPVNKN